MSPHEIESLRDMLLGWPTVLRALRRAKILTAADLNAIRFAERELVDKRTSVAEQIRKALADTPLDREMKRKRPDED